MVGWGLLSRMLGRFLIVVCCVSVIVMCVWLVLGWDF